MAFTHWTYWQLAVMALIAGFCWTVGAFLANALLSLLRRGAA